MLYGKDIKDYDFMIYIGEGEPHSDVENHIEDFAFLKYYEVGCSLPEDAWKDGYVYIIRNPFKYPNEGRRVNGEQKDVL